MENLLQENYAERKFGHIYVAWKIKNICFETSREDFLITSPEFFVEGSKVTKWRMMLNPKQKLLDEDFSVLYLEKLDSDTGSNVVDIIMWFFDSEGMKCGIVQHSISYENNFRREIKRWSASYIRSMFGLAPLKDFTLNICCHMIIRFEDQQSFPRPRDIGLRSLSEDLANLYSTSTYHDLVLRTEGKDIPVHKVILYSQSSIFVDIIDQKRDVNEIDLSYLDSEAMVHILAYLYSGNIEYVSVVPSVLIYDYALRFNLFDLQQYYCPDNVIMHSVIELQQHAFTWMIKKFNDFDGDCLSSPLFTTEYMDATWQLHLYPKGVNNKGEYLSIFANIVQGEKPDNSCLHFSLLIDEKIFSEKIMLRDKAGDCFGIERFMEIDYFDQTHSLTDDTVQIYFRVEILTDSVSSSINYTMRCRSATLGQFCNTLSLNLKFMLKEGLHTDIAIDVEGTTFKAHKCILAARSHVFNSMLSERTDDEPIVLNMKPIVFSVILNYIYSGVYDNFKSCNTFEIYEAAERFSLTALKQTCLRILQANLNVKTAYDVLEFSHAKSDTELKTSDLKHIYRKENNNSEDDNWKSLKVQKTFLRAELSEFMKIS